MIKIQVPNREIIIDIIEGLLEKRYSREEVIQWRFDIIKEYDYQGPGVLTVPLSNRDGYWEFVTFVVLTKKNIPEGNDEYFIRDEDLVEYLNDLKRIDCTETDGEIIKLRPHQLKPSKKYSCPLIQYIDIGRDSIKKSGVFFKRGIFENLGAYIETALIDFKGSIYIVDYYYDQFDENVIIEGLPENKENLADLLLALDVKSSSIKWISEELDTETCELYRLDDNGNKFSVEIFNSYIEAEIQRNEYERKGHKQAYLIKRNLTKK